MSDVNNTRGYELGVFGIGFSGGTAAAVYVLHDPSVAPGVFDDGASEAALCQRIIDQGAFFGGAIVGSDSRVAVFGMVTAPTFGPGKHNYICMVDGAGRMSGTDVERFHLEHTVRVVPSVATAGDSVTIFAQDYPNPGAGLTALKVADRLVTVSSSSSVGVDGSATATFVIPSDLAGVVSVEAAWGNVSGTTRMTVAAAQQSVLGNPTNLQASPAGDGQVNVTWQPAQNAEVHYVWSVRPDGSGGKWNPAGATDGSITVAGLAGGQLYWFIALAGGNVDGVWQWSQYSNWASAEVASEFSSSQLEMLFDEIIDKTEQREAFSEIKERNIGFFRS